MDKFYKDSLLKTMINRACTLSSTTDAFNAKGAEMRFLLSHLEYPTSFIDSSINTFLLRNSLATKAERSNDDSNL